MYKATNIDTDKALKAIEEFRRNKSLEQQRDFYGMQKYYDGVEKGLELAENLFECSNYEKEVETVHTKIQYKGCEYSISEMCQRMDQLEDLLCSAVRTIENQKYYEENGMVPRAVLCKSCKVRSTTNKICKDCHYKYEHAEEIYKLIEEPEESDNNDGK